MGEKGIEAVDPILVRVHQGNNYMSEICIITAYKKYYDIIEKTCQELMEYGANDGREIIDKYNLYEYIRCPAAHCGRG